MKVDLRVIVLLGLTLGIIFPSTGSAEEEVGFDAADANDDAKISVAELRTYFDDRLGDDQLPQRKIFIKLDADGNGWISATEFEKRHDVIKHFMGADYFDEPAFEEPADPGVDFAPFRGLNEPVDDRKIFGALYHRYFDLVDDEESTFTAVDLKKVPQSTKVDSPIRPEETTVGDIMKATAVVIGGGDNFFTGGAVLISDNGLALTNYHVAMEMKSSHVMALTADGKTHRAVKFIAGNRQRDVALIQLEGNGFHAVPLAKTTPNVGDDLVMVHHSESRFYSYDRGYVSRHPTIGEYPWLEVSMDYAPGASGCGIFNKQHELVGLVSTIQYGDGPSLAEPFDPSGEGEDGWQGDEWEEDEDAPFLLVKHAVPLSAIQSLLSGEKQPAKTVAKPVVGKTFMMNGLRLTPEITPGEILPVGEVFTLKLRIEVPANHHIYAPSNKLAPTKITFNDSSHFEPFGEPILPRSLLKKTSAGVATIWTGKPVVQQKFVVKEIHKEGAKLGGVLNFSMCNEEICLPPEDLKFEIALQP